MAKRYALHAHKDGTYSIIDLFTGWTAEHCGRKLTRIPADMAQSGVDTINALDAAERANPEFAALDIGNLN